jgi:DNA invertase Pin-like site-specific DNA recombinase
MTHELSSKVMAVHLQRNAYLYVRQSTPRQLVEHAESTRRQYALQQRALQLGWRPEQVIVIDNDLGQSGAFTVDREGFQKLVAEVSLGRAGIVLGLEVSRLARNSTDWHRLLEICAYNDTLILDEDGIYSPSSFNDRLLLGLKGTMSEAELHVMRMRMQGGVLTKAKRGELRPLLPIGFLYDDEGNVVRDPDQQVQACIHSIFSLFRRTGSSYAAVRHFKKKGLLFPSRPLFGPNRGELCWIPLQRSASRAEQSPLRGNLFLRSNARAAKAGRRTAHQLQACASRTMARSDPECPPWLHHLGDVRNKLEEAGRELACPCYEAEGATARGASTAAGAGHLRQLWAEDECPLSLER